MALIEKDGRNLRITIFNELDVKKIRELCKTCPARRGDFACEGMSISGVAYVYKNTETASLEEFKKLASCKATEPI